MSHSSELVDKYVQADAHSELFAAAGNVLELARRVSVERVDDIGRENRLRRR